MISDCDGGAVFRHRVGAAGAGDFRRGLDPVGLPFRHAARAFQNHHIARFRVRGGGSRHVAVPAAGLLLKHMGNGDFCCAAFPVDGGFQRRGGTADGQNPRYGVGGCVARRNSLGRIRRIRRFRQRHRRCAQAAGQSKDTCQKFFVHRENLLKNVIHYI